MLTDYSKATCKAPRAARQMGDRRNVGMPVNRPDIDADAVDALDKPIDSVNDIIYCTFYGRNDAIPYICCYLPDSGHSGIKIIFYGRPDVRNGLCEPLSQPDDPIDHALDSRDSPIFEIGKSVNNPLYRFLYDVVEFSGQRGEPCDDAVDHIWNDAMTNKFFIQIHKIADNGRDKARHEARYSTPRAHEHRFYCVPHAAEKVDDPLADQSEIVSQVPEDGHDILF